MANRGERTRRLSAVKRNDDLLVAAAEDNLAVLDRFDRELVGLVAHLQSEDLAFVHHFAVDDRVTSAAIDRDRADEKRARRDILRGVFALCGGRDFARWSPADRPERIPRGFLNRKGRLVFHFELRRRVRLRRSGLLGFRRLLSRDGNAEAERD